MRRLPSLLLVLTAAGGCAAEIPAEPSFQLDVMPILAANCVRCHGEPRLVGPAGLRLDSYADLVEEHGPGTEDDILVAGAATYAPFIATRIESATRPMPPRFGLAGDAVEVLLAWWGGRELGDLPPRGAPRADNRPPAIAIEEVGRDAAAITLRYDLHDPDGDLVAGQLRLDGEAGPWLGSLHAGRDEVVIALAGLVGSHAVVAFVDDGAQVHRVPAGSIDAETP